MYYPSLTRHTVALFLPLAEIWGVSEVARSPQGFTTEFLETKDLSLAWLNKRNDFISRHMAQIKNRNESVWKQIDGATYPTPRHLSLIMWAYSPDSQRLNSVRDRMRRQLIKGKYALPDRP